MNKSPRIRRTVGYVAAAALSALAVGGAHTVYAATTTDPGATYTGCLRTQGDNVGKLFAVKAGSNPGRPCTTEERPLMLSGGDLTSFRAGTGLTDTSPEKYLGTTPKGAVNVELAPSYRLPQNCQDGGSPVWKAGAWDCAAPVQTPRPIEYVEAHNSQESLQSIGNDWANVATVNVPAGSWRLTSLLNYVDKYSVDHLHLECRLDVTGKTFRDHALIGGGDGLGAVLPLAAFHTSATPFTASLVCRDSLWGEDASETGIVWSRVRIDVIPSAPVVHVSN
jgi:hypothetical protein